MPNFQLQDTQKVPYQISALDKDGNPTTDVAAGVSPITVASSDPTIASVVPDPTPAAGSLASGFVVGQAKLGTVQINATAADNSLTGQVSIDVVAGAAASIAMNLGAPVSQ